MGLNSRIEGFIRKTPLERSIGKIFRKAGFDIVRTPLPEVALLSIYGINLIFDAGANVGQYARRKRRLGYTGKIVSFEPLSSAYTQLENNANGDLLWQTVKCGLGDYDGEALINISQNSVYSSILNSLPFLNQEDNESVYVAQEKIIIHKIDSIFNDYYEAKDKVFLKIDTQGYERKILEGAQSSLNYVSGIQLELSFVPHYEGELLLIEMVNFLSSLGFTLVSLEPLNHNLTTGKLLQADGIFVRLD